MRVSTNEYFLISSQGIRQNQVRITDTQEQLSSGLRINRPSDDPVGATKVNDLAAEIGQTARFQVNGVLAGNRLAAEEGAVDQSLDLIFRLQELTLQAINASQTGQDRQTISTEVDQLLEGLVGLANSRDSNGDYLFAGSKVRIQPFVEQADRSFVYQGDQGRRQLEVASAKFTATSDSGVEVWGRIPSGDGAIEVGAASANAGQGNFRAQVVDRALYQGQSIQVVFGDPPDRYDVIDVTDPANPVLLAQDAAYSPGISLEGLDAVGLEGALSGAPAAGDVFTVEPSRNRDLFATVQRLMDALQGHDPDDRSRPLNEALVVQHLEASLQDLDQAMDHMINVQAKVGSRRGDLDIQQGRNQSREAQLLKELGTVRDLDYAEAATRLAQQQLALQAALQSFASTQGLNLFDFL